MFEGLLASRSVLPSASILSPYSLLAFFFWVSPLQSSCLFLSTGFLHFLLPCSANFICKKWKQRPKGSPCWFMVFCFSCAFSLFFSSSVPFFVFSFSPSLVTKMDEDNGTVASMHSRWSLLLGTLKMMATPVHCFFFLPSADALCGDDEGDGDENVLCWLSSRPCLCVFLLLTVVFRFLFFFRSSPFFFCLASHLSFFCNFVPVKTFTVEKMNPCSLPFFPPL